MTDLLELLANNPYPGRGILVGRTPDGNSSFLAYFIMGRSQNSQNRVFSKTTTGIITKAADPAKMQDPSLIIYAPIRTAGNVTIVSNGDQTDTIWDAYSANAPFANTPTRFAFEEALHTRTFEPDSPNFTPRISGVCVQNETEFSYKLSILKSSEGNCASVQRFFYHYPQPLAGQGHFISTYQSNGSPLPSFAAEPLCVDIPEDTKQFADDIWRTLHQGNKISLFVRCTQHGAAPKDKIYNKYQEVTAKV